MWYHKLEQLGFMLVGIKIFQDSKKFFYIFLIINAIFWIAVESLRNVIGRDAMEAIIWGNLWSVGTNKHPPLSGWFAGSFYTLFGENDIGIYILGQLCLIVGIIFIYKLAKNFLSDEKALCSALIMMPCVYYTYQAFYDNFNCNYLSIALWAMLAYFFYKTMKTNKLADWAILGLIAGLCFLAKYQVAFLFFALFIYMLIYERQYFKQKGVYFAALIGFIIILPHLYWLYQNEFFSFIYLLGRTESALPEGTSVNIFQRFLFPIKFYLDQILALMPSVIVYLILAIKNKNIGLQKFDAKNKDLVFILLIALLPMLIISTIGLFTTSRIVGAWASTMVGFFGIFMFYVFPIKISENSYPFFKKMIIGFMCIWLFAMVLFVILQKKVDMAFPYQEIMPKINEIWAQNTNNSPLKYVKGDPKYLFHFRLYNPQKPVAILDTYGYKNPWINEEDIKVSGILIIGFNEENTEYFTKGLPGAIPKGIKYQPQKIEYEVKNVFNGKKPEELYYIMIPPAVIKQGEK